MTTGRPLLLQRALRNGVFSVASQVVSLVLGLLFAGMTIRYLGNARAGFFAVAGLILGWFGVAGMGGFRAAAVHRLATLSGSEDWSTSRAVLGTVLSANLGLAIPFALGSVVAFPLLFGWSRLDEAFRQEAWCVVLLGAISFMLEQWSTTLRGLYNAHQRFDLIAYSSFAMGLAGNLARLAALVAFQSMAAVAVVNLMVSGVWLGVDVVLSRRMLAGWVWPVWRREELRPLMRFGMWAWSGDLVGAAANNLGSMLTTYYLGSAPLPYVSLPQRIAGQVHQFFAGCCYFLFPTLAAEGETAATAIAKVEDRMRWFVACATWACYAALVLGGKLLLTLLAGAEFAENAYLPLVMFCGLMAVNALNIVYSFSSMAVGRIHPSVVAENSATVLSALSTPIMVPWLGYLGACWAAMWKVPAVLIQCIWTRRVLGLGHSWRAEVAPYLSPAAGILVWACVAGACGWSAETQSWMVVLCSALGGGIGFVAIVWLLEARLFGGYGRWKTATKAMDMIRLRAANLTKRAA